MPLLHHDQVLSRRARERKLLESEENNTDTSGEKDDDEGFEYHPSGQLFQGLGTHYVDLWVGTPTTQRQTLIVDTGSDLTAFPCEPCPDCGKGYHTDETYKDEDSVTFHLMDCDEGCNLGECKFVDEDFSYCEVSLSYAEGSHWHAYEVTDQVYLGGPHDKPMRKKKKKHLHLRSLESEKEEHKHGGGAKNTNDLDKEFREEASEAKDKYKQMHHRANDFSFELNFACQYKITGLFRTQLADGIMGMENSEHSLWRQMYEAGMISSKSFALCFSYSEVVDRSGSSAGQLTLGGADKRLHSSPMVYAENYDKQGWYSINVKAIYLKYKKDGDDDEKPTIVKLDMNMKKFNSHGIILDSGTTESFLPSMMLYPFEEAFSELTGNRFRESFTNELELKKYPTMMIQIQAAQIVDTDELKDEKVQPLEGLAGSMDLDPVSPNDVILEVTPENYMKYRKKNNLYSNALHMTERSGFGVMGANVLSDHDVLFDVEKNRIGIAKSSCNYID